MTVSVETLLQRIHELEDQLETEFNERRAEFKYKIKKRRVIFEEDVARHHHELKTHFWTYIHEARLMVLLTAPFIYAVIIPFVLLDIFVSVYQAVCFPVYDIKKVRRSDFIVFDRHQLGYLNGIEKFNCLYCAYGNGLVAFVREVASRTEQYWCPIKHAKKVIGTHVHYHGFTEYGDAVAYHTELEKIRKKLVELDE